MTHVHIPDEDHYKDVESFDSERVSRGRVVDTFCSFTFKEGVYSLIPQRPFAIDGVAFVCDSSDLLFILSDPPPLIAPVSSPYPMVWFRAAWDAIVRGNMPGFAPRIFGRLGVGEALKFQITDRTRAVRESWIPNVVWGRAIL